MSVTTLHAVEIKAEAGHAVAVPRDLQDMEHGSTLQINSRDGAFRIVFKPWPFKELEVEVTSSDPLTFQNKTGVKLPFEFFCYITPHGSNLEVGYPGSSGGHGSVNPPGHP